MKQFREQVKAYFTFTRKERTGISTLIVLILLLSFLPFLYPYFIRPTQYDHSRFEKEIATLRQKTADSSARSYADAGDYYDRRPVNDHPVYSKKELFYFDPNTISVEEWKRLGLRDRTIQTIRRYLEKGGRFRKPEDIARIWGLHADEVGRLLPYVRIEESSGVPASYPDRRPADQTYSKPALARNPIDINMADTTAFIALPGIGSKLASRIVAFREKLGGFISVEQVKEIYGLPDSTFQKVKDRLQVATPSIRQLDINTATLDELKSHPYIRYNIANAIVQYRAQHGPFGSLEDLKKVMLITGDIYTRIQPYLTYH